MVPDASVPPPSEILAQLRAKSKLIVHQQERVDRGEFKSVGAAIGLQKLKREREQLRSELPPFYIVPTE